MPTVRIYQTHIEVTPYKEGDCKPLEMMLSVWISQTFTRNKLAYAVIDNTLYIPRGVGITYLERLFNTEAIMMTEPDPYGFIKSRIKPKYEPRNSIQEDCINFLCGEGGFGRSSKYSQISLNADTGDGKTFCTVYSIVKLGYRTLIITHIDKIKQQWIDTCINMFDFSPDRLLDISGTPIMEKILRDGVVPDKDIFFINHQTLNSFMRKHSISQFHKFFELLHIGIKVYDEAHLEFKNIVKIDMFSNTLKTIYLTATFDRSDPNESKVFKKAFNNVMKFGQETLSYSEKRRHIVYFPILYSSNCPDYLESAMKNNYGFDSRKFFTYAWDEDEHHTLRKKLEETLNRVKDVEGKILIISPKIETCESIKKFIENDMDLGKTVGTIHSKNSVDENERSKSCDIISSTMKSCGTGVDIKGLRILINLEPIASTVATNQLSGRLREYAPDKNTYLFDLVDVSVRRCYEMYKTRLSFLKKKCKEIVMTK